MPIAMLEIPTPDGTADAFAAYPDDGERHPGVLLYMDAIGLRPVVYDMVQRLAEAGYYVLAPNVFYRQGPAPVVALPGFITADNRGAMFAELMPMMGEFTVGRVLSDAAAYLEFLISRPQVRTGSVGVVGYCMGAVLATRTAAAHPDLVTAAAGFHPGALVTDDADSPHLLAPRINAELLYGLAEGDLSPEAFVRFTSSLDKAGVAHSSQFYPNTTHGFTMADTSAFSPAGSQRHWAELLPLLSRNLT